MRNNIGIICCHNTKIIDLVNITEPNVTVRHLRGDVTIFCGVWFSVHNFTILQYFPLIKVSYCSSFKELSIDVLTLYVAYLLFMLQVQTVSWVKKTY